MAKGKYGRLVIGIAFDSISEFWQEIRIFAYRNKTLFEILFILVYSFEQLALV